MAFAKYLVPALAFAGAVLGDNCPDTNNGIFTIKSQGDASQLQDCDKFDGTVVIDSSASGNLQINGVQQITGNLSCFNATGLTSISSDQLNSIGGTFLLNGLTVLTNLQMSSLSSVNILNFEALANLESLSFEKSVTTAAGIRAVNTGLTSLDGIELSDVNAFEVTNNDQMTSINVNNLTSIDDYAIFVSNGENLDIKFPNLLTAANLTFGNISSLSVDSLSNVTGSFGCYSNNFQNFSAPNLTFVGNAFVFDNNPNLKNISAPSCTKIGGGFEIANNTNLHSIDGFNSLKAVGGALNFIGNLTNVTLPDVTSVQGAFYVNSTGPLDCTSLNNLKSNHALHGNAQCHSSPTASGSSSSSSGSSSSSSSGGSSGGSHKNAASPVTINNAAMGLFGAVAALLLL